MLWSKHYITNYNINLTSIKLGFVLRNSIKSNDKVFDIQWNEFVVINREFDWSKRNFLASRVDPIETKLVYEFCVAQSIMHGNKIKNKQKACVMRDTH